MSAIGHFNHGKGCQGFEILQSNDPNLFKIPIIRKFVKDNETFGTTNASLAICYGAEHVIHSWKGTSVEKGRFPSVRNIRRSELEIQGKSFAEGKVFEKFGLDRVNEILMSVRSGKHTKRVDNYYRPECKKGSTLWLCSNRIGFLLIHSKTLR